MTKFEHPYLDLARMEMLRRVRLKPRGMAEGTFAGPHKSPYRGTAVEFADFRSYTDGDDIRLVDWKVFARTDKHYVRLYEAERNLLSYLVVDTSGSMGFGGVVKPTMSKLEYAGRLAAAMAYLVVDGGDEVGLSLADESIHTHAPARSSWSHLGALVGALGDAKATGKTNLSECLIEVFRRSSRRGVLIVLSDFLDQSSDFWQRINLFRNSRFDVMLFHIVHPEELELPDVPMARFMDSEGGGGSFLAEPEQIRKLYHERFNRFLRQIESGAKYRGCDWIVARTDQDPYRLLQSCFLERERGR
jgi:uncharacterized protein (DUF58 family)